MRAIWTVLLTVMTVASADASVMNSRGLAEICFSEGSTDLTPEAKITIVRLLHSTTSQEWTNWKVRAFGDILRKRKEAESVKLGERRAVSIKQFMASVLTEIGSIETFAHSAARDTYGGYAMFQIYLLEWGTESKCWARSPKQMPAIVQFFTRGCLVGSSEENGCLSFVRCDEDGCTRK